ncbi:MAG: hypothetical protein M3P42_05630 [Actinomycetota bacterium]|nr:hypothetical protein [Actinomycetota bacterium]
MEERKDKADERVEDLEVRDDEAREIGGGRKAHPRGNPRWNRMKKAVGLRRSREGSADA